MADSRNQQAAPGRADILMAWVLVAVIAAYSLAIGDLTLIAARFISAALFAAGCVYLLVTRRERILVTPAFVCPFSMSLYGLAQTAWSDQKIVYNGITKSLFWFTLSLVGLFAAQTLIKSRLAEQIRAAVAVFGTFEALLGILQQASHTGKYFWLIDSGYPDVYGTFGYYNNFAQLIELTLPVTLWEAVRKRELRLHYLLFGAVQIGAVVASSSRAGSLLVVAELMGVLFLAWWRRRPAVSLVTIALAVGLSLGFTCVAGYQHVIEKLERPDQLANRKMLNQSSVNMIKQRPLTGWGLGAYVPVYKMFALYDDGTWVNQAHNDYLEWAAEGGIPYALIMMFLLAAVVVPAVRSVWGIGLLAFCAHAAVDYPFARLGTAAWYFLLAGMLAAQGVQQPEEERKRRRRKQEPLPAEAEAEQIAAVPPAAQVT